MSLTAAEVRTIIREELERLSGKQPANDSEIMTRAQVAELLGVEAHTVTRWVKDKGLPGVQLPGGEWRFQRSAVTEWMFNRTKRKVGT